ncbi:outer membrane beta-barrel protein [Hymenobacter busanensis]|uniref:Outer membrane beta-barrel protein n=1 Tax=Hymenobacter busanensis TaxID=2607656 RepID=A0A7L5A059_9BACT|nr:outer membrane beta-barrel protein [Hymenobacter busanensis]KAA9338404.1 outer membrane beta-barrel protein [Hymenobacter busanensis]QHJ09169.1 outer membrane beta-barrel protein [Hymenobacter busanensis]
MTHRILWLLAFLLAAAQASAQTYPVSGRVVDGKDQSPLIGANVLLTRLSPDSAKTGAAVDPNGNFAIEGNAPGSYRLTISFLGYQTVKRVVSVRDAPVVLGTLPLNVGGITLKGVEVTGRAAAAVQKGDTSQYDARAFKTNPDANAQDLITKMPGVTVDPGTGKVQAQGEQVQRVLVDGKEFFGNDPDAVLKNLPAEAIDKIQVYDRASDQSQFTGFDDGNQQKTINIVTKPQFRNGQFGRVLAGAGRGGEGDNRYRASGNINFFKGKQRFSVLAQSNNVNEQNFGTDDLLGVVGSSARGGGGGRNGAQGGGNPGGGGGNNAGNFLVGQSGGISKTNAVGLNYSDTWGKKTDVQASYFFNRSTNTLSSSTNRRYTAEDSLGRVLRYQESSLTTSTNMNNRFNLRLEHKIDSLNSLLWQPRLSVQNNDSHNNLDGGTFREQNNSEAGNGEVRSSNLSDYRADNIGINFGQSLLYRHRFHTRGRTFSLGVNMAYNTRSAENFLNSVNEDFTRSETPITTRTDQFSDLDQVGWQWSANANYTEPLSPKSQLQLTYNTTYSPNDSDKRTNNLDPGSGAYSVFNPELSNVFTSRNLTNAGGISYRYNDRELQWSVGAQVQHAQLNNEQEFPRAATTRLSFLNVLPNAQIRYNFSKQQNLRLNYQMRTSSPSISQLQEVVNNSNPLQITTGNPNLRQENNHNLFLRYSLANVEKSTSFFALVGGSYTNNNITNSTRIFSRPTEFRGVIVPAGGQVTQPVNLDGQYSLRSFANYTVPLTFVKSNLNLNTNANFSQTPGLVSITGVDEQQLNYSRTPSFGFGAVLSSNVSPNLDFTLSSNSTQTYVRNSAQTNANRQYFRQNTNLRFSWIIVKGVTMQSDVNHVSYTGLSDGYNQQFVLWNASVGKKFLPKQQAELKLYAFDILKQNNSIQPNQTSAYVEDVRTNILTRYLMLMFTYNIRNFGGGAGPDQPGNTQPGNERFNRPGGFGPGGPGGNPGGGPGGFGGPPPGGF